MNLKIAARLFIICVAILMAIGASMVLSASSMYSALKFDDFYKLFDQHLIRMILAIGFMFAAIKIPYEYYKKVSLILLGVSVILLMITLIVGANYKGAGRWISIGGISIQPSEIAKFALIIHLAHWLNNKKKIIGDFKKGYLYPLACIGIVFLFIVVQPNLSTSILVSSVGFMMLFVGGARIKHLALTLLIAMIAAGSLMMTFSHSRERVMTYFNSVKDGGEVNVQVLQAKIALGSGGGLGLGIGNSRQSDLFLPESYGDFIFSVLGEETGYLGSVIVLLLYLGLFLCGIIIAKNAKDDFGKLIAFGISFTIILNAYINAAVVTGVFPTTGIPLPFISFGGTSIIFLSTAAGIVANIGYRSHKFREGNLGKNVKS